MQTGEAAAHGTEAQAPVPSTRQWLIEIAQREISERGFTGVSMRSIAARANVDPSLVRHYFGAKQNLLLQAMNISLDAEELVAEALRGTPTGVGRRTVRMVLTLCDEKRTTARTLVGFSAPLSSPETADLGDTAYLGSVFARIAAQVSPDRRELRASMVTAQVLALVVGRYLVHDPVMAGSSQQDLVRIVGRSVQEFLTGPLPDEEDGAEAGSSTAGHDAAGRFVVHY
jgi:AcrR family transcriptional regulator